MFELTEAVDLLPVLQWAQSLREDAVDEDGPTGRRAVPLFHNPSPRVQSEQRRQSQRIARVDQIRTVHNSLCPAGRQKENDREKRQRHFHLEETKAERKDSSSLCS